MYYKLFHQDHLAGGGVFTGLHFVEIDAAGQGLACVVPAVEDDPVVAGGLAFLNKGTHQLAFEVIDFDDDGRGFFHAEADGSAGIEGIGPVAFEFGHRGKDRIVVGDGLANSGQLDRQRRIDGDRKSVV